MSKRELGVIVARLQSPFLTPAHQYLFGQVATRVNRILALLGVAPVPCLKRNPLEYAVRERMLRDWWDASYPSGPDLIIMPLYDSPTDEEWAMRVDASIAAANINGPAILFSGPDGCGPTYQEAGGRWPIEMLDAAGSHASKIRANLVPRYSEDFRAGVIYGIERDYIRPRLTVDAIIRDGDKFLLAHKKQDNRKDGRIWRLVGGFVDVSDASLEAAVKREVLEETGLTVSEPMYVGSCPVDDWRYRGGPESIITTVFSVERTSGDAIASDDIDEVGWFGRGEVEQLVHPIHAPLLRLGLKVQ